MKTKTVTTLLMQTLLAVIVGLVVSIDLRGDNMLTFTFIEQRDAFDRSATRLLRS